MKRSREGEKKGEVIDLLSVKEKQKGFEFKGIEISKLVSYLRQPSFQETLKKSMMMHEMSWPTSLKEFLEDNHNGKEMPKGLITNPKILDILDKFEEEPELINLVWTQLGFS